MINVFIFSFVFVIENYWIEIRDQKYNLDTPLDWKYNLDGTY